jgi:branched-subunit amino acid transport protein AzlD
VAPFERALRRRDPLRVAVVALGLAVLLIVAAYTLDLISAQLTTEGIASVLALIVVAGSGLLYAWRLGAGGIVE